MRQKKVNVILVVAVLVAVVLLMVWLFLGTTLEEDSTQITAPMPMEQTN